MHMSCIISHAQAMQYFYAWVTHHLSCVGRKASLMHRSRTISHAQVTHHLSCSGHAPSLMHRPRTISHAEVTHHLSCTGHTPPHAQIANHSHAQVSQHASNPRIPFRLVHRPSSSLHRACNQCVMLLYMLQPVLYYYTCSVRHATIHASACVILLYMHQH